MYRKEYRPGIPLYKLSKDKHNKLYKKAEANAAKRLPPRKKHVYTKASLHAVGYSTGIAGTCRLPSVKCAKHLLHAVSDHDPAFGNHCL